MKKLISLLLILISAHSGAATVSQHSANWQGAVVYSPLNSMGSGVPVSRCHVLTNEHVVRGSQKASVRIAGRRYAAKVVASDTANDMVLLKLGDCPIKHYAKLSPVAPQKGDMLTSVYYKPGFNLFQRVVKSRGRLLGVESVLTEENKRMTSLAIDDPRPYLRASGGGVSSKHGLVSVIFGIAPRLSKRATYAVNYYALRNFLQQNRLYSPARH